jgi:hypothetical protein
MACFALVISHDMPSNMLLCITWIQNMPRHDKVKINGVNGQTGGKNRSTTFVLTAFISFGLFNIFGAKGKCQKLSRDKYNDAKSRKDKAKCV